MTLRKLVAHGIDIPFQWRNRDAVSVGTSSVVGHHRINLRTGCAVQVGEQSLMEARVFFDRDNAVLVVGDRTFIGKSTIVLASNVEIGNDVLISWGCTIVDHDSHALSFTSRRNDVVKWLNGEKDWETVAIKPVVIRDKAWIGFNALILKGIEIGEGAVVAAGSVVTKNVAPWTIVAGNPARVVREIPEHER